MSVKVYFHSKNNFLAFSGRMAHKIYKGEKIQAQVNIQNINLLERYLKGPHEEDYKVCSEHDFDMCLYDKLATIMMEETEDNCTAPWIPNNTRVCTKQRDINSTFMITMNRFTNQEQDCDFPCLSVVADIHGKNYRKYYTRKYAELYVYYGFNVYKSQERYHYTFYRWLAEVGGYVGLFLGYSFFNLVSTIEHALEKQILKITPN